MAIGGSTIGSHIELVVLSENIGILIDMDQSQFQQLLEHQTHLFARLMKEVTAKQAPSGAPAIPVPQPSPLVVEGDMEENLNFFERCWNEYSSATGMDQWPISENAKKVSILLSVIGEAARRKYFNFELTPAQQTDPVTTLAAIRAKIVAKRNVIIDRLDFFSAGQFSHESVDDYVTRLKTLAKVAKLGNLEDELVTFKVVTANRWPQMRTKMLSIADITLAKAVDMCRAEEIAAKRSLDLSIPPSKPADVNKVSKGKAAARALRCKFCGDRHEFSKGSCPALGKRCHKCNGKNHFGIVCKAKTKSKQHRSRRVKEVKDNTSESGDETTSNDSSSETSEEEYEIGKIFDNSDDGGSVLAVLDLKFGEVWKPVTCEVDTGANTSLIGISSLVKLCGVDPPLLPSKLRLQSFGGNPIKVLGQIKVPCRRRGKKYRLVLQVVDVDHRPLLSAKASRELGFVKFCKAVVFGKPNAQDAPENLLNIYRIKAQEIINKHQDLFTGYGKFAGTVSLEIDDSIVPSIQPPRRVPIAMREKLKKELEQLERDGLIVKEASHTDWVSNLVIVQRPGSDGIRVCLDPVPLNKALKRPNLQFVTLDEILPELGKARVFSTVDAKKGFWHVVLDEASSKLTTFWTPFGRFRWTRLPFGIASAPEIFQLKLQEAIEGLEGVECIADDVLVYGIGDTFHEALVNHNKCLEALLVRLEEKNVKLNLAKLKLCQTSVKFYGHVLTDHGLKPDETKVAAIRDFPTPTNRKEVHRFVGMVNYLSRFIRNLSVNLTNLRRLISEEVPWQWTSIEEDEFSKVKSLFSNIGTLRYYDPNLPLTIECDASCYGLGAAVFQEDGVVGFASRTLTAAEKNYAQIEKELLAILFACVRFDQLIVGNPKAVVKTDHRPLINIFQKPLLSAPRRLQHMLLNLQRYSLSIVFVTGKDNVVADTLSRAPVIISEPEDEYRKLSIFKVLKEVEDCKPTSYLSISDQRLSEIIQETKKDSSMQLIVDYIRHGWPTTIDKVPDSVRIYYNYRNELSTVDGLVLRNDQIVVPYALRRKLIKCCHANHGGMESTLKLARANLFWPGMSSQIKDVVKECAVCAKYAASQPNPPMMSHNIPVFPFQMVSMDVFLAEYRGRKRNFLISVDHYSDFFEVDLLEDMTPDSVIRICKKNFARHGVPQTVLTDNGTNFVNRKMVVFARDWDFEHITSAPHHQQANGKAEAAVKIAKRMMKKCEETGEDFWFALLHWRNVPNKIGSSPVARLFSRSTRCSVPSSVTNLLPKVVEDVPETIEKQRKRSKFHYDAKSRNLPDLQVGSPVYAQLNPQETKIWTPGVVTNQLSDRSYMVNVNGSEYRRSLVHLKPRYGNGGADASCESAPHLGQPIASDPAPIICAPSTPTMFSATPQPNENLRASCRVDENITPPAIQSFSSSTTPVTAPKGTTTARDDEVQQRVEKQTTQQVTHGSTCTRPRRETRMPRKFKDYDLSFD